MGAPGGGEASWSIASLTRGFFSLSSGAPLGDHPVTNRPDQAESGWKTLTAPAETVNAVTCYASDMRMSRGPALIAACVDILSAALRRINMKAGWPYVELIGRPPGSRHREALFDNRAYPPFWTD